MKTDSTRAAALPADAPTSRVEPVITVRHLGKKYSKGMRQTLWRGLRDISREIVLRGAASDATAFESGEFWAVRDVSFEVLPGKALAIIGRNGAGKSTILKMLCGLIKPDAGMVRIRGRVGSLLDLGSALDPLLTGRENIYVIAALLGWPRVEVNHHLQEMIEFSGLTKDLDMPVKFYSTGMKARLSYSVVANLRPDVLIVDEVLAVGDWEFQRKCIQHMQRFLAKGGALVFVSHSPYHIQSVSNDGLLLEKGSPIFAGSAVETLDHYFKTLYQANEANETGLEAEAVDSPGPSVDQTSSRANQRSLSALEIDKVRVEGISGGHPRSGEDARLHVSCQCHESCEVICHFSIWTIDNAVCITGASGPPKALGPGRHDLGCSLPRLPLMAGRYLLKIAMVAPHSLVTYALLGWAAEPPLGFQVDAESSRENNAARDWQQLVNIEVLWE